MLISAPCSLLRARGIRKHSSEFNAPRKARLFRRESSRAAGVVSLFPRFRGRHTVAEGVDGVIVLIQPVVVVLDGYLLVLDASHELPMIEHGGNNAYDRGRPIYNGQLTPQLLGPELRAL